MVFSNVVLFVFVGLVIVNKLLLIKGDWVKLIFYFFFRVLRFLRCKVSIFIYVLFCVVWFCLKVDVLLFNVFSGFVFFLFVKFFLFVCISFMVLENKCLMWLICDNGVFFDCGFIVLVMVFVGVLFKDVKVRCVLNIFLIDNLLSWIFCVLFKFFVVCWCICLSCRILVFLFFKNCWICCCKLER